MKKSTLFILILIAWKGIAQVPCIVNTNSMSFSGSTYIQIPPSSALDITDSVTVEAWVYPTMFGVTSAQNSIVCKHGWSVQQSGYVLRAGGNGELSFNIGDGSPPVWHEVVSPANVLALNTWNHVAGSYDGDSLRLFVDGVEVASFQYTGTISNNSSYDMRIGALADPQWGPDRYWNGNIDEVRVWHRALSASEILANYNHHLDTSLIFGTGLVGYWRMNDGTGTTAVDLSGNNSDATLMGTTWSTQVPFNEVPATPGIINNGGLLASTITNGNQWFLNGNPIPGANGQFYTPTSPGTYTVQQTSAQGCTAISAGVFMSDAGIAENNVDGINIYPNPVQDVITLETTTFNSLNKIELRDVQGKIILNEKCKFQNVIKLNVHDFAKGVYFIKLIFDDHVSSHKIMID